MNFVRMQKFSIISEKCYFKKNGFKVSAYSVKIYREFGSKSYNFGNFSNPDKSFVNGCSL